ncbi:MAG TPA: flagellar hook-length control protein FliK [Alphaproteobacteria bacterium]|nr:flagellar hook-length control protein FliK [Alphaproteobacteria bacterium]
MDIVQIANASAAAPGLPAGGATAAPGAGGAFSALLGGLAAAADPAAAEQPAAGDALLVDPLLALMAAGALPMAEPAEGEANAEAAPAEGDALAADAAALLAPTAPQPPMPVATPMAPPAPQIEGEPAADGSDMLIGGAGDDLLAAGDNAQRGQIPAGGAGPVPTLPAADPAAEAPIAADEAVEAAIAAATKAAEAAQAVSTAAAKPAAQVAEAAVEAATPITDALSAEAEAKAAAPAAAEGAAQAAQKAAQPAPAKAPAKIAETATDGSTVAAATVEGDQDTEAAAVNGTVKPPEAGKPAKPAKEAKGSAEKAAELAGGAHHAAQAAKPADAAKAEAAAPQSAAPALQAAGTEDRGRDGGRQGERQAAAAEMPGGGPDAVAQAGRSEGASFADALREARPALRNMPLHPAAEQVSVHIQRGARDGLKEMTVQLTPHDLGRIEIKLEFGQDGRVSASVMADKPQTLDLLQRDARGLERALQDAGLRTDSGALSFNLRGQNQQQQGQPGGHGGYAQAARLRGDDAADQAPITETRRYVVGPGRVDVRI